MKANKGFTLIELAVVLAVIAVLAAILTPLVTAYIDQARTTRARNDTRQIAQGFNLHKRDTGRYPIFASVADATADVSASEDFAGGGSTPVIGSGGSNWALSSTSDIDTFLNVNTLGLNTTIQRGGRVAYYGPYVDAITADPWGNAYIVTGDHLQDSSSNRGYVISAGPNGEIDTDRDLTGSVTAGGDDIVAGIK